MTIREYAKINNFEIMGKLTRRPEFEWETNWHNGSHKHSGVKCYSDEAGNVYHVSPKGCCIITVDGIII